MTALTQKRLAVVGAAALIGLFVAANAQFISAALRSQPACVVTADAAMPAKRVC